MREIPNRMASALLRTLLRALMLAVLSSIGIADGVAENALDDIAKQELIEDAPLSAALAQIVAELGLDREFDTEDGPERISLAVVDLTGDAMTAEGALPENTLRFGGVNADNFIYPASVYKMYVAAEVLRQVQTGKVSLDTPIETKSPNVVDRVKEIRTDPRPLLAEGETVTVGYLLDLMITRSDNSAANCLIDLAGRNQINALMHAHGWHGSEVTRKFLKRTAEDPAYRDAPGTETCALHAADFLSRVHSHRLVSPWVSMQLECLLGRQLDNSKLARGLPSGAMFYHKTGWYAQWTHDVGIVDDGQTQFVIAAFLPLPESTAQPKLEALGRQVYALMKARR